MKDRITIVLKGGMVQDIHTDRHDEYEFLVVDLDTENNDWDEENDCPMPAEAENYDHEAGPYMAAVDEVREALKRYDEEL
jgi:hypothetical protein